MLERYLIALRTDDAGAAEPAALRERLRDRFPRGATRRMTQLGMVLGAQLLDLDPQETDTIIYASSYGETRALEDYLDSFPAASPTLFQTSIHPSAVQQALIGRQQSIGRFFPTTGYHQQIAQALVIAVLDPAPRVLLCGGEERGTWLLEQSVASDRTFGFTLALSRDPAGALARLSVEPTAGVGADPLGLTDFFAHLIDQRPFARHTATGVHLTLSWL
jgi:hypothetical protein